MGVVRRPERAAGGGGGDEICGEACTAMSTHAGELEMAFRLVVEILHGLEWSGRDERFRTPICPVCGAYRRKNKHFPDCDLDKALSFARRLVK